MKVYNVKADCWTNGEYCLKENVLTPREAERWVEYFTDKYVGRPFPNGEGFYPCKNFRIVVINVNSIDES